MSEHSPTNDLAPDDILERVHHVQLAELPDGRLLLRHPGGVSLLGSVSRGDVEAVLELVDGRRTAAEIVAARPGRGTRALLRNLLGEAVRRGTSRRGASRCSAGPGRIVLWAAGETAEALGKAFHRQGLREIVAVDVRPGAADLDGARLFIAAPEEVPYGELLTAQEAALATGTASLFLIVDADGIRLGPATVPGASACWACAQWTSFRFLARGTSLLPAELLAALADFRTGRFASLSGAGTAVTEAVTQAAKVAAGLVSGGEWRLVDGVDLLTTAGRRELPSPKQPGCPLCADLEPSGDDPRSFRAAELRLAGEERRRPRLAISRGDRNGDGEGDLVRSVGIVGGGTAGYLAALALRHKRPELDVTLLASSALPVIGVGEATTPLLPQFLHADLGFDIHQLFREVRPTLKLGIRFDWGEPGTGAFPYPFGPVRPLEAKLYDGHLDNVSLAAMSMAAGRVPSALDGPHIAYHLDNGRFVAYLERRAREVGVEAVDVKITDIRVDGAGEGDGETVTELLAEDGRRFRFDFYVDATGFRSLLLGGALGSPFQSYASSLFTDRALVASAPHGGRIAPHTGATTWDAGWCWSTPQVEEDHLGYVFASAFLDEAGAETEMRRAVPALGETRLVRFRAGRREHFLRGNVAALGNAYGFVEPLESTALHMLVRQIGLLVRSFPRRSREDALARLLSREVGATWDYLRFFLALHYRFNRRRDTDFWRACREDVELGEPGELVDLFLERGPLSYQALTREHFNYPDPLWGPEGIDVLLLGQGVAGRRPRPALDRDAWRRRVELGRGIVARAPSQADVLRRFTEEPASLERLAAAFRAVGPAFPARV